MTQKGQLLEKFKEAAASVLPIVIIVGVMCLTFIPMQADLMLSFIIGSVMLIVGMGLFTLGSDVSMTPISAHMGAKLTKSRNLPLILIVSFLLGIAVTVSEPDLTVLADNVPAIDTMVLIVAEKARKAAIMKAIMKNAGPGTEAAAICFSLPVTNVEGLRRIDAEDDKAEDKAEE